MYLTKIWVGRHWWYIDTKHSYSYKEVRVFRRWIGTVSYMKGELGETTPTFETEQSQADVHPWGDPSETTNQEEAEKTKGDHCDRGSRVPGVRAQTDDDGGRFQRHR